jgi:hypothetical protein
MMKKQTITVARKNKIPIKREPFLMEYLPGIETDAQLERLALAQKVWRYSYFIGIARNENTCYYPRRMGKTGNTVWNPTKA